MNISAVIPTLNEEQALPSLVQELKRQGAEVVVADGGSRDKTVALARRLGVKVVQSPPGRGRQLNAGARAASGEGLFFVHADTRIPGGAVATISRILQQGRFVGGAFSLAYDSPRPSIRLIARAANWRARRLNLPYGDQGFFITRSAFRSLGGFRDIPLMEDIDLVRRLKRRGRMVILPQTITASARRLEREGVALVTLRNWTLASLFLLGIPAHILARHYPVVR